MKKTAVEWLIDEIKFARNLCDEPSAEMDIWHTLDVLIAKGEEAKEREKESHRKTYHQGLNSNFQDFEQYYSETFNID